MCPAIVESCTWAPGTGWGWPAWVDRLNLSILASQSRRARVEVSMSLKAKIEAVIYASEEPVTLAQLVGLLGLEAQAELDRMASRQEDLPLASGDGSRGSRDRGSVSRRGGNAEPQTISRLPTKSPAPRRRRADCGRRKAVRENERRLREFLRATAGRADCGLRGRRARPRDSRGRGRLPLRDQARVPRRRPRVREVAQAAAEAHPAGAGDRSPLSRTSSR